MISNFHNLIHLFQDLSNFHYTLSECSTYQFENALYKIKQNIRSGSNFLSQHANRTEEMYNKNPQGFVCTKKNKHYRHYFI